MWRPHPGLPKIYGQSDPSPINSDNADFRIGQHCMQPSRMDVIITDSRQTLTCVMYIVAPIYSLEQKHNTGRAQAGLFHASSFKYTVGLLVGHSHFKGGFDTLYVKQNLTIPYL